MRLLPLLAAGFVLANASPALANGAVRVTTDSLEYCQELAQRLEGLPRGREGLPRSLGQEGLRLCAEGHVRTGIARLRRAIRVARADPPQG